MSLRSLLLLLSASGAVVAAQPASRPTYETILRHGTIVDGTGGRLYQADVGIHNGHLARIGDLSKESALVEVDVAGLYVAPGFINIHSHASSAALATAENMLTQGVTTEILNPDGGGPPDIVPQLNEANSGGLALNVGAYIGFNSVWASVMGAADRRAAPADIERMRALVLSGLDHGAWGISAGLDYKPAYYAQTEEVIRVVEAAAPWRTNFPNHDRLTPESGFSSRVGIAETIAIGEKAAVMPIVTHMKAQGREQGTAPKLLAMMQQATDRGRYTAADAYPYLAGQTSLGALLIPAWAQSGGREEMLKRFKDPAQRARIVAETESAMAARFGGPEGVFLPATRRELVDLMREQRASAGETVLRVLEQGDVTAILRFGAEADLVQILQHPTTSIACDCGASTDTHQHPRAFGSFPRVLGRYVRETKALTWEDAVRKMTALPANTIGMLDRGFVATGMAADLTVFDPATVIDRATYEEPARLSEGIRLVLVNGVVALRDGKVTGARGGRVLMRTGHMPSRPMNMTAQRRVALKGTVNANVRVDIDVSQAPGTARAQGSFRLADASSTTVLEGTELGVLQTTTNWASFTARIRNRVTKAEGLVTVIVERADPFVAGNLPTVFVQVDNVLSVSGTLREPASSITLR
jgi:N-acyl-D-aspartate/D-glutamate deacylase